MRNLIEMLFKREPSLNYVIAEYKPSNNFVAKSSAEMPEYDIEAIQDNDEMEIDNLYQNS